MEEWNFEVIVNIEVRNMDATLYSFSGWMVIFADKSMSIGIGIFNNYFVVQ